MKICEATRKDCEGARFFHDIKQKSQQPKRLALIEFKNITLKYQQNLSRDYVD